MNTLTAEIVAHIGQVVKEKWPTCDKDMRLELVRTYLNDHSITCAPYNSTHRHLRLKQDDMQIYLSIDGDLGIYYINEDDDREPIHIQLLVRRTVVVTKVYEVKVPCFDNTPPSLILQLAKDYEEELIEKKNEVQTNK